MNITVIGSGYVGLVSYICFAKMGITHIFVDLSLSKFNINKNTL
jgi:UDP-glucose 6-dehydrogenase